MNVITAHIEWSGDNFSAYLSDNVPGMVVVTASTLPSLKRRVRSAIRFHASNLDDEEKIEWLMKGDYKIKYVFSDPIALLKGLGKEAPITLLSRTSKIKPSTLDGIIRGCRRPTKKQIDNIREGFRLMRDEFALP